MEALKPEIIRKIDTLREYIGKLSVYEALSVSDFISNEEKLAAFERWYLLMVDEAVDINSAIAYQLGQKVPESYKSSFYDLILLKVLEENFVKKIADSIKVRNELTHNYEKRQKSAIIIDMKTTVELYREYLKILINKFIEK